jgi:hypothetical protein
MRAEMATGFATGSMARAGYSERDLSFTGPEALCSPVAYSKPRPRISSHDPLIVRADHVGSPMATRNDAVAALDERPARRAPD